MRRKRFDVPEPVYREHLEVSEGRTVERYEAGGQRRIRQPSLDRAISKHAGGLCGEWCVCQDTGGKMELDVRKYHGSTKPDVLLPDGRWIEVRTCFQREVVFGFYGDDPMKQKAELCALVVGTRDPLVYYLVGYAKTEDVQRAVYQKDMGHGLHWVCDPDVFGEFPELDTQETLF